MTTVAFLFIYLALFLGAFATYRMLILAEYQINYFRFGCCLVEAFLLAKVIALARALRLGEGFRNHALTIPIVYRTLWFSVFALAFFVVEHLVVGWWHGKPPNVVLEELIGKTVWEIMAQVMVLFLALVPVLAVWEIGRRLGEDKLFDMFFKANPAAKHDVPVKSTTEQADSLR
jgi:hypothetical protein